MTEQIGARIKEARLAAGMSQKALAEAVDGVSSKRISEAERGLRELTDEQLVAIAEATGVEAKLFGVGKDGAPEASAEAMSSAEAEAMPTAEAEAEAAPDTAEEAEAGSTPAAAEEVESESAAAAGAETKAMPAAAAISGAAAAAMSAAAAAAEAMPAAAAAVAEAMPAAAAVAAPAAEDILKLFNAADPVVKKTVLSALMGEDPQAKGEAPQGKGFLDGVLPMVTGILGGGKGDQSGKTGQGDKDGQAGQAGKDDQAGQAGQAVDPLAAIIGFLTSEEGKVLLDALKGVVDSFSGVFSGGEDGGGEQDGRRTSDSFLAFTFFYTIAIFILIIGFHYLQGNADIKLGE